MSKTFKKSQMSGFFDVSAGWVREVTLALKPRADITRYSKQEYKWIVKDITDKKDWCDTKGIIKDVVSISKYRYL